MGKKPFRRLSAEEGVSAEVAHEHFAYEPLEITIIDPVFEACHNGKLSRVGIIVGRTNAFTETLIPHYLSVIVAEGDVSWLVRIPLEKISGKGLVVCRRIIHAIGRDVGRKTSGEKFHPFGHCSVLYDYLESVMSLGVQEYQCTCVFSLESCLHTCSSCAALSTGILPIANHIRAILLKGGCDLGP